ncbi:GroES-like protein [Hesseltinella vesiculosa]|uniref:GroES-like protein n=1 Tax=Hesseltinella vesiculosa TaxID=101127 RepID=A0A1X2GAL2_9FUNG|nr:GroES-like protein [Hesseltinella vesiculosa]
MSADTFHGWAVHSKDEPMKWTELPLKEFDADAVEMKVTHCGICGSDIHTMDSGWGPTPYPCVTGHEITGTITRVGENVKKFKVGDRAGVGAQSGSCLDCEDCKRGDEHLCSKRVGTYASFWPNGDKSFGGYADKWRGHQHFVFKIPETMTNETAATFFCAGVTTYSPLKRHNVTKGSRVGVKGIGGLGHFAVMWAKAMGAEVTALSTSDRKREDAKNLGCSDYVVLSDKEGMKSRFDTFTHIIDCSYAERNNFTEIFSLLRNNGTYIVVGIPEQPLDGIPAMLIAAKQITFVGSFIGSPAAIEDMLKFADEHKVRPWLNKWKMSDAPAAVKAFREGKPRYRFVLENDQ